MGAKLNSKTHLHNMFFYFFQPFLARLASKCEKSVIMTLNKMSLKNQEKGVKTQNPLKKFHKQHQNKLISKQISNP